MWGIAEELIGYCALPRGARACAHTATLALDAREGGPQILRRPQDGALIVVAARDDFDDDPDESTWVFSSLDGVTWSGPALIGVGMADLDAAVLTADGAAVDLLSSDTGTNRFQRAPLAGPPATFALNLATNPDGTETDYDYPGDMIRLRSGRTMALLGSPADGFVYRVLAGADPFADAVVAAVAGRTGDQGVGGAARDGRTARRVRDVRRAHPRPGLDSAAPQVVRKFNGRRWGRPRGLFYEVSANTSDAALAQDGKGRLHAAIVGYADSGRRACIAYARSSRKRWFTRAVSVHQTLKDAEKPGRVRLAVDDTGRGVVAWSTTSTPAAARVQWLKPGRRVTRPRKHGSRGCPPYPR